MFIQIFYLAWKSSVRCVVTSLQLEQPFTFNHRTHLLRAVIDKYCDVRLHYLHKIDPAISTTTKRQKRNKLSLFEGVWPVLQNKAMQQMMMMMMTQVENKRFYIRIVLFYYFNKTPTQFRNIKIIFIILLFQKLVCSLCANLLWVPKRRTDASSFIGSREWRIMYVYFFLTTRIMFISF